MSYFMDCTLLYIRLYLPLILRYMALCVLCGVLCHHSVMWL